MLRRRTMLAGLAAAAALRPDCAFAAWPERNVTLMHGLTAGGGVDVSARVIAEGLSRRLGQQIVVEPKPGAAGTLAAAQVARATPDGYTLGYIPSGYAVTAAMYKSLPYHPIDDFTIIGQVLEFPFVMVTYPEHTIRNMPDLIKAAKTRAEPLLCGVPGAGTPQHLLIEYFSRLAGIKIQVGAVPRRQPGAHRAARQAARLPDRSADRADRPDQGRRLRAIAVTGDKRFPRCRMSAPSPKRASPASPSRPGWAWSGRPSCRTTSRRGSTARSTRWSPSRR